MKKLLAIGIAIIFLLLLVPSVSATWCDANYGKKAPILINNTGGAAQTDYQVMLNYSFDSDMNANFSDIRVYNESDCSLIPLWNESAVASSWNKIWFNATNIPASSWTNDTYYLYYNYSSASTTSNITSTFLFGDDFTGTTINEKYLTSWSKSGSNPLQDKTCQNWFIAVYSNYNSEDKIYIFEQRDAAANNTIEAWSFTRANASTPANWTDHGVVFNATGAHEDGHIEPHGIIFETQSMADAREGVGAGLGTRKWRLYYCAKGDGEATSKYSANFIYASESNLTNWTAYASNPVYDHDAEWGFADTKVCIYDDKVWMFYGKYKTGVSGNPQYFTVSSDGISSWTDKTKDWHNEHILGGTLVPFSNGVLITSWNAYSDYSSFKGYFTTDGDDKGTYSGNPLLTPSAWATGFDWTTIVVDKDGGYDLGSHGTWYMFYIEHNASSWQLNLATSTTLTEETESSSILDTDKWNSAGSPSIADGIITVDGNIEYIQSKNSFNYKAFKMRANMSRVSADWAIHFGFITNVAGGDLNAAGYWVYTTTSTIAITGDASTVEGGGYGEDIGDFDEAWHNWEALWKSGEVKFYVDGNLEATQNTYISSANIPILIHDYNDYGKAEVDWILVRKYASPEPTASLGTEQSPSVTYTPPNPTNLQNTTGNFWVNYTWDAGSGNVTNGYNVSWNSTWDNTTNTFMNKSVGASNWANITVWAWNSSSIGTISAGSISDQIKAAAEDTTFTVTLPIGYSHAYFDLTGIAGGRAHDTSGNANDGTIYGATVTDGKYGDALQFDGTNDYVSCGNDASLDVTSITIETRVKMSEEKSAMPLSKEDVFYLWESGSKLKLNLRMNDGTDTNWKYLGTAGLPLNQWQYFVATYDSNVQPSHDGWTNKTDIPQNKADASAAVYNNKIYVFGGYGTGGANDLLDETYEYDVANDSWAQKADMPTARWGPLAVEENGIVYVFGGNTLDYVALATVEAYNVTNNTWSSKSDMPIATSGMMGVEYNGKIYLFAGTYAYEYNPGTDAYIEKTSIPESVGGWGTAALVGSKIYVMSGSSVTGVNYEYDPVNDSWTKKADVPYKVYGQTRENPVINNKIYLTHGQDTYNNYLALVQVYDPSTNTWELKSQSRMIKDGLACGVVSNKLYAIAGRWADSKSKSVEEMDPTQLSDNITFNAKIYKDGVLVQEEYLPAVLQTSSDNLFIGAYQGTSYYFNGTIDEVRIYNRALNLTEIQDNYNNSINRTGLVGEWTFDHGASTQTNVTPAGQNSTMPFYNVTNTGNVNLDVGMQLNATVSTITLKADADNDPTGADTIGTSLVTIYPNLGQGSSANVWLWSDFDHTPAQTANRTVYINVSQS